MRHGLGRWAAIAAVGMMAAAGLAQPAGAGSQPQPAEKASQGNGPTVSVNFKGGTLAEYVKALRAATSEPVNIALQGEAASIRVEPMELRDVGIEAALHAALGGSVGRMVMEPDGTQSQVILNTIASSGGGDGPMVFSVSREVQRASGGRSPIKGNMVEVYSLQPLVQPGAGGKEDAAVVALTAIETALALTQEEGGSEPEIKFHQDSGLLLVRGTGPQVSLVGQVVKRLTSDHDQRSGMQTQLRLRAIERQADVRKAEIRVQVAEGKLEVAEQEMGQLSELVEKGSAPSLELTRFRAQFQQARADRELAMIDLERLSKEAEVVPIAPPRGDDTDKALIQTLKNRIDQLEKELAELKGKPAPKPNPR
jgi:hypothetical protein